MAMSLNFPNASRAYDEKRRSVSFWGYDSAFEIAFHVGEDALQRISPETQSDEASIRSGGAALYVAHLKAAPTDPEIQRSIGPHLAVASEEN
jgi:hypothetical protein